MPRIDTSTIEGFDTMTTEQRLQALMDLEVPERIDLTQYVKKTVFDKTAHDLSEANKKLKSKMSEDELAQAERERLEQEAANKYSDLESKYNDLLKKSTKAEYKAKYIASGYKPELAEKAAEALVNGKTDDLLAVQTEHEKDVQERIKAELLADPKGPGGFGANPKDGKDEPENVKTARQIGARRANESKATNEALSKFLGR